jgi:hypothetical protein
MGPQSREGQKLKKQTIEHYKANSQTPKKTLCMLFSVFFFGEILPSGDIPIVCSTPLCKIGQFFLQFRHNPNRLI